MKSLFLTINFLPICNDILNKIAISHECNIWFQNVLHQNWGERTAIYEIAKFNFDLPRQLVPFDVLRHIFSRQHIASFPFQTITTIPIHVRKLSSISASSLLGAKPSPAWALDGLTKQPYLHNPSFSLTSMTCLDGSTKWLTEPVNIWQGSWLSHRTGFLHIKPIRILTTLGSCKIPDYCVSIKFPKIQHLPSSF